jgi:hypothetical protein
VTYERDYLDRTCVEFDKQWVTGLDEIAPHF